MARSKSSGTWLKQHFDDPYVKQSWQDGYRSRAAYKLEEIQKKDKILKPGMIVVDLGAAPGSWSQYVAKQIGANGRVFAVDILAMDPIPAVNFIQGDFLEASVEEQLLVQMQGVKADLVLSDMAPNMSGIGAVDQPRSIALAEIALHFAGKVLRQDGAFLVKVFEGAGTADFLRSLRKQFKSVVVRKPAASKAQSAENYFLAKGYLGSRCIT